MNKERFQRYLPEFRGVTYPLSFRFYPEAIAKDPKEGDCVGIDLRGGYLFWKNGKVVSESGGRKASN